MLLNIEKPREQDIRMFLRMVVEYRPCFTVMNFVYETKQW